MLDLLIRNALVVNGLNEPPFHADVGVRGDKVVAVAPCLNLESANTLDATGLMVAPGFIDVHTHDDLVLKSDPYNLPKLSQGITTVVAGNCGFGNEPSTPPHRQALVNYNRPILGEDTQAEVFPDFAAYAAFLRRLPKAQNIASLQPHGAVYIAAKGFDSSPVTQAEAAHMLADVEAALDAGALGVSLGLMYAPGCYCAPKDLLPIAHAVAKRDGILTIHMKSESDRFEDCLRQAAELSISCGLKVEISHLKHVGKNYVGRMKHSLELLSELRAQGADLSYDMYPYTMGSTTMAILFPTEELANGVEALIRQMRDQAVRDRIRKRLKEDWDDEDNLSLLCGWENVIISSVASEANRDCLGQNMVAIARARGVSPEEAMMTLFAQERGDVSILLNHIQQSDMEATLTFDGTSLITDGLPGAKSPHPRLYGSFPRFLRHFVRENKLLSWETAIYKMTGQPAQRFGLEKRGVLAEGGYADLVVFDPERIADQATFDQPRQYPLGISHVVVNGKIVLENGRSMSVFPGAFIAKMKRGERQNP